MNDSISNIEELLNLLIQAINNNEVSTKEGKQLYLSLYEDYKISKNVNSETYKKIKDLLHKK